MLGLFNIRCEQTDGRVNGREYHGLVYFALGEDGKPIAAPFKASRLGKFAGREAIDGKYEKAKEKINIAPTKDKVADALAHCSGKDDFIARLKEKNIDVVFRYTDEGRIYGVTFIDHDTFNVLNGSRLARHSPPTLLKLNSIRRKSRIPVRSIPFLFLNRQSRQTKSQDKNRGKSLRAIQGLTAEHSNRLLRQQVRRVCLKISMITRYPDLTCSSRGSRTIRMKRRSFAA